MLFPIINDDRELLRPAWVPILLIVASVLLREDPENPFRRIYDQRLYRLGLR